MDHAQKGRYGCGGHARKPAPDDRAQRTPAGADHRAGSRHACFRRDAGAVPGKQRAITTEREAQGTRKEKPIMGQATFDRRSEGIAPPGQKAASPPRPAVINRPTTKTPPGPKQLLGFVCPEISCHSFALSDRFRRAHQDHLGYGHAPNRRCQRPGPRVPRRSLHAIHLCTLAGAQLHGDADWSLSRETR